MFCTVPTVPSSPGVPKRHLGRLAWQSGWDLTLPSSVLCHSIKLAWCTDASSFEAPVARWMGFNSSMFCTMSQYQARVVHRDVIWGSSHGTVEGITVIPSFDEVNNFATLEIPDCETRIKYRAFDRFRAKHQKQLPGLTIQAPQHAEVNSTISWLVSPSRRQNTLR